MASIHNNQVDQEQRLWKIKLEELKQENVLLKYRLSEMVDINEGSNFMEMAEYFQNELLIADDKLKKLLNSLENFYDQYWKPKNENESSRQTMKDYNKLKNEMIQFENRFISLKKEFNEKM